MAGELRYNSGTGQLMYKPATGQLVYECVTGCDATSLPAYMNETYTLEEKDMSSYGDMIDPQEGSETWDGVLEHVSDDPLVWVAWGGSPPTYGDFGGKALYTGPTRTSITAYCDGDNWVFYLQVIFGLAGFTAVAFQGYKTSGPANTPVGTYTNDTYDGGVTPYRPQFWDVY